MSAQRETESRDVTEDVAAVSPAHDLEQAVRRELSSHPELSFSSLVIHRIPDGVCLEGVLEVEEDCPDVDCLARRVAGVEQVLNHLVVKQPAHKPPAKG
jgi:osmotically-inducible protein OsmY